MRFRTLITVLALGVAACGDPATNDDRGYTKAPLENPGLLVAGEKASPMAALSEPDLPRPALDVGEEQAETPASGGGSEEQVALADEVTREQFDQGKELFAGQGGCQACHGPNGTGSQLAPNLTDDQWLHVPGPDVDAIAQVITEGVAQPVEHPAPMPPMGGANLSADQVQALAGYVASLSQG